MANIDEFKNFVKQNPKLTNYIKDGSMTWQKFYEFYDIYGSSSEVWDPYLKEENVNRNVELQKSTNNFTINDTINFIKNMDFDSIQNGINSIQRVVGLVSDLTNKNTQNPSKTEYTPRPLYKHFED